MRALRARKTPRKAHDNIARESLSFGAPVMDSAVTLIADGKFYYRGRDVGELARSARFEQVATLLWKQDGADPFAQPPLEIPLPTGVAPLPRAISLLSIAGEQDLKGLKLTERGVAETGARIIRLLTASFCKMPVTKAPIHERFAEAWGLNEAGADLIRTALSWRRIIN